MVAIIICDRFKWTLEEYLGTDASYVDKIYQYIQVENEARSRQHKKVEQNLGKKSRQ